MRNLILLLFVSCLAFCEASFTVANASGGGGNGWAYWESPTTRRVAPCKMSANGQKVIGKMLDSGYGFVATPSGLTTITTVYELNSISANGRWAAGSAFNGAGEKAALLDLSSGAVEYVSGYQHVYAYAVDDNGTLCGDFSMGGNTAFRKPLGAPLQTLGGSFDQSSVSATTADGSAIAIGATPVMGLPDNVYWCDALGNLTPAPSNGDTFCFPRGICNAFLCGETGTALAPRPFKWGPGDPAKTILPGFNGVWKGSALCTADYPAVKMIGGYVFSGMTQYAILWLPDAAGGWVAREIKPFLLEAGYPLGTKLITGIVDISPDGQYLLLDISKSLTDDSYSTAVVLNTWFGTNLGQVKAQAVGSAVTLTNRVVVAAPPDAVYVENDDRSAGIRINLTGHTVNVGDRISVSGTLSEINGEKVVTGQLASLKVFPGIWPMPKELTVPNKVIANPDGLCLYCMLVRTVGSVKAHAEGSFVIDDGSSEHGLTVLLPAGVSAPALGDFVGVCGVGAKSTDAQGCLLLRSAADIEVQ